MISLEQVKAFYPPPIRENAVFSKFILKEYVQLHILDFLSMTKYARKLALIGGTSLRLVKGIDRFSEDLDFDCKRFSKEEFIRMSGDVRRFLERSGFNAEARHAENAGITAFRCGLYFPEFLFNLGLTGHRDERFLVKLEAEDQGVSYRSTTVLIKGCGLFFSFPVPPEEVLCAMKISALLDRGKGRDFYDVMFLLSRTQPDYSFLETRFGIKNLTELKAALENKETSVNLKHKQKDFEHLLFDRENSRRILHFGQFVRSL